MAICAKMPELIAKLCRVEKHMWRPKLMFLQRCCWRLKSIAVSWGTLNTYRQFIGSTGIEQGKEVVHFIEALCYKPEDHGFRSWWGHGFFINLVLAATPRTWGRLGLYEKWVPGPDNLDTFMCRLSGNSWILKLVDPQGPVQTSRPLQE